MDTLKGKVAVVTGGSRDIGRAVSIKLAQEGAKVCINYCHSETKARETLHLVKEAGGEAILVKADVTKAADVRYLMEETAKAFGPHIDILVNNAGGIVGRKTSSTSPPRPPVTAAVPAVPFTPAGKRPCYAIPGPWPKSGARGESGSMPCVPA